MNSASSQPSLAPPRGAAISGVIFAVLTIVGLGLIRYAIPGDWKAHGTWLIEPYHRQAALAALTVVPFAGIAFLWFMGVLRSRLGEREDQFYATVFLASGLLFVACLFAGAAVTSALIGAVVFGSIDSETYYFGRSMSDALFNIFAMKMAGVFIFSTCTIGLRTALFPRWMAYLGYATGLLLLLIIGNWRWITLVFPFWMLIVSAQILITDRRSRHRQRTTSGARYQAQGQIPNTER
jgi:hypothetical protein